MMMGFNNLLTESVPLSKLTQQASQRSQANRAILTLLDPILAKNCRVANIREGTLIFSTTSPAWRHRLHFAQNTILTTLKHSTAWQHIHTIECYIDTFTVIASQHPLPHTKRILSQAAADTLTRTAQTLGPNTKLSQALLRLAQHTV
jgi:hypothetical protein